MKYDPSDTFVTSDHHFGSWKHNPCPWRPPVFPQEEEEEFRDVFYTMRDDEVAGWVRSLQLRGIELPNSIKDEVFLIVGERRMTL